MRRLLCLLVLLMVLSVSVSATAEEAVNQIIATRTAVSFSEEAVAESALEKIVEAGLAATSARNLQPWHFAVITNQDIMAQISGMGGGGQPNAGMRAEGQRPEGQPPQGEAPQQPGGGAPPQGGNGARAARAGLGNSPAVIIVYAHTESVQANYSGGNTALFDCGLATQNMIVAANLLGYGTRVVAGPVDTLNGAQHDALCELLNVSTDMSAVAVLLIGVPAEAAADAVSSASVRAEPAAKVSYSK